MALKIHYATLSIGASVDQQTGHLSLFDLIEEIRVPVVPVHLPAMVLALVMQKPMDQAVTGKFFIHHLPPDGTQNLLGVSELNIPREQGRVKAVFRFGQFPLAFFGAHRIVMSWANEQGQKQGEHLFDFDVIQVQQVAQGAPPPQGTGNAGPGSQATH